MASANRDAIVEDEVLLPDGSINVRVRFLVAGRTLPRRFDALLGDRRFTFDSEAVKVLEEANTNINEAFARLGSKDREVKPFDASMGVYLYTRTFKPAGLPPGDIIVDGKTMRSVMAAKKLVSR